MKKDVFEQDSRKLLEEVRQRYGFRVPYKILKKKRVFDDPELDVLFKVMRHVGLGKKTKAH